MVDVNKPVTNPDLIAVMEKLKTEVGNESQAEFIKELEKAHFLAPVNITPPPEGGDETGKTVLKQETLIQFQMITDNDGKSFFLVFTDWFELKKWQDKPNQQTLIITFDDVCAMVLKDTDKSSGFVINPFGQNILLRKPHIRMIKGQASAQKHTVERDTKVMIGEPKEYPRDLTDALKNHLKTVKEVKKAYLMLMVKDNEQSFLIVVDFRGDHKSTFDGIAAAAAPHLKQGQFIDMVPANESFGQSAIKGKKPFYTRSMFGF